MLNTSLKLPSFLSLLSAELTVAFTLVLPQPRHTEPLAHIWLPCKIKEWESVESELRHSSGKVFNEGGLQGEG